MGQMICERFDYKVFRNLISLLQTLVQMVAELHLEKLPFLNENHTTIDNNLKIIHCYFLFI